MSDNERERDEKRPRPGDEPDWRDTLRRHGEKLLEWLDGAVNPPVPVPVPVRRR